MNYHLPCETGEMYHVFNKSIAKFRIFNDAADFHRFLQIIQYYQFTDLEYSYSDIIRTRLAQKVPFEIILKGIKETNRCYVDIIAYCIMPTHIHLILKQKSDLGIAEFMSKALNSFTRFFNLKHHRKGPLWVGKYKRRPIKDDEDLWHLTRYIHLNPVTAYLVNSPDKWAHSSFNEYLRKSAAKNKICRLEEYLDIDPESYRTFVSSYINQQRELEYIKKWEK